MFFVLCFLHNTIFCMESKARFPNIKKSPLKKRNIDYQAWQVWAAYCYLNFKIIKDTESKNRVREEVTKKIIQERIDDHISLLIGLESHAKWAKVIRKKDAFDKNKRKSEMSEMSKIYLKEYKRVVSRLPKSLLYMPFVTTLYLPDPKTLRSWYLLSICYINLGTL